MDLEQIVKEKAKWIGATLRDDGDPTDRRIRREDMPMMTKVVDITLIEDYFLIHGEEFSCGGVTRYTGVRHRIYWPERGIAFYGYGGHEYEIFHEEAETDGEEEV